MPASVKRGEGPRPALLECRFRPPDNQWHPLHYPILMPQDWQSRFKTRPPAWRWFLWIVFFLIPVSIGPWPFRIFCLVLLAALAFALTSEPSEP